MNQSEDLKPQKNFLSELKENLNQFDKNITYSYKLMKFKLASYLAQKRYLKKNPEQIHFNGIMNYGNFLVLMLLLL